MSVLVDLSLLYDVALPVQCALPYDAFAGLRTLVDLLYDAAPGRFTVALDLPFAAAPVIRQHLVLPHDATLPALSWSSPMRRRSRVT
jgi:hypothetical protein